MANGNFVSPRGVCVDKKGLVYVTDASTRVQMFTEDGKWLQTIDLDCESSPLGLNSCAVGQNGSIYASSYGKHHVGVFRSADGSFMRSIGSGLGDRDGCFKMPTGVALTADESLVFVSDWSNCRLSVFTADGKFSHNIGGPGFMCLSGVAVGPDGTIYVTDHTACRVKVYTPSGQHVRQIGARHSSQGGYLRAPWGVAVSSQGLVYVADANNNGVHVFSSTGAFMHEICGLVEPHGVAVSESGMVFVTQSKGHSVVAFPGF